MRGAALGVRHCLSDGNPRLGWIHYCKWVVQVERSRAATEPKWSRSGGVVGRGSRIRSKMVRSTKPEQTQQNCLGFPSFIVLLPSNGSKWSGSYSSHSSTPQAREPFVPGHGCLGSESAETRHYSRLLAQICLKRGKRSSSVAPSRLDRLSRRSGQPSSTCGLYQDCNYPCAASWRAETTSHCRIRDYSVPLLYLPCCCD